MPNTYANLGASVADVLGRAGGMRSSAPRGYREGIDTGSQHMLRSAQTGQAMADTDKILYELGLAKEAQATTGPQIAEAMGVPTDIVGALGRGETMRRPMPGAGGPVQPTEVIPQAMRDKLTNANTLKILQQLAGGTASGGTAETLMNVLTKGQDLGIKSNLQAGTQETGDVASIMAAMEGKFPGRTGAGGGSVASKVQEMSALVARNKTMGMDEQQAHDAALLSVYGDPENEAWTKAFTRAYQSTFSVKSAIKAADASVARMSTKQGAAPGNDDPLGLR